MDQQSEGHPSLIYFGQKTPSHDFPLVLFVGREPQVDERMTKGVGPYDFRAHPRCAFWNVAYCQVAKADGNPEFGTAALKRECVQVQASPITFADALPICLSNRNDGERKRRERVSVPTVAIEDHVDSLLRLDLFKRVKLVVLSGHERPEFQMATNIFRTHLEARSVPYVSSPFLYPTNSQRIQDTFSSTGAFTKFRSVLSEFRSAFQ